MIPVVHTISAAELLALRTAYHALPQGERARIGDDVATIRLAGGCTRVTFDRPGSSLGFATARYANRLAPESSCGPIQSAVALPGLDAKAIVVTDDAWWAKKNRFAIPPYTALISRSMFHVSEMFVPRSKIAKAFYMVSFVEPGTGWFFCEGFANFGVNPETWSVARVSADHCSHALSS